MTELQVRRAVAEDMEGVWPLARDFATSFRPERELFERTFRALLGSPNALVLVAHLQEGICAYLLAHTHETFLANGPVAWVEEVMVDGQYRREGIGRALMTEAERWGREQGASYTSLASRRAGAFYLQLGYEDSAAFYKKTLIDPDEEQTAHRGWPSDGTRQGL
ncbi:GNAT family N-acetyltransferase [Arthrobacter sp. ISL-30]|uniref:GNAT family N-acetyltransferase n=1 Tax=Arthrobacter sp. ISL-30 TaxID=2819109 RepID=UPI001BEBB46C|nr:GNAT family N-acetyltransferase [Arthrobacter sp. ISL-30]MBT2514971.1 GNAT family N-acetyltransferase [Arthrobacter sp. ISL-30]